MYKRRFITIEENHITYDLTSTLKNTVLREQSLTDEFYHEKVVNADGSTSISLIDPIFILFNQERLDSLGSGAVSQFLDSLQPKSDSLAELRSKCSDDDLMKMLKSRHLQSPAEVLAWCRYMNDNVEKFNAEVKALVEAQSQNTEQVETKNSNTE